MRLTAGQRLGPYEIVAPLGHGGMGEVYRARDTRLRRDVALKLIPPQAATDAGAVDRFRREAHAASALNHPNIVTIYEIGDAPEGRFIAMELVDGRTLRQLIAAPSAETAIRLGVQIARALAVAHDAGIVHRDIKPENIMVRADGYVKVLDFGLARFAEDRGIVTEETTAATEARSLLGTVRYMSPEQARGESIDRSADVFALGVVLYELCTSQHPFDAESPLGVLHAIAAQTPVAPARLSPGLPDRLNDLILRTLSQDRRRRPSASDVAVELAELERAGPLPVASAATGARRMGVGRAGERAQLHAAFEHVAAGHGLLITVAGEAGIGKTTVVEDFLSELDLRQPRGRIARGRCSERLAGTEAYLPFLEALDDLVHRGRAESLARQVRTLAPTWYEQLSPIGPGRTSDARQLPTVKAVSPERFKLELATLLHEVSRQDPTILFFDDLHWADVSTVDLLSYLATRFDATRLLIVGTYRPSELQLAQHPFAALRLALQGRGLAREIALPFLDRQDVEAYLAREFPGHGFPPALGELVHRRTEGNPLFMVDLIRELRERAVLREQDGQWTATASMASIELEMPATVRSLIQRTIDRLDEPHRRLLTAASVQGHDFDTAVIARALDQDAADVEDQFDLVERAHGLIRCTGEKELPAGTLTLGYRFVHVLYQNALYASLRPARRTSLSGAVARALVDGYGAKAATIAAELAMLFEAARELSPAAEHLLLATQNAVRVFAIDEAIALARRGLRVLESLPASPDRDRREVGFQVLLGAALTPRKGYTDPELADVYGRTRVLCQRLEATPEKAAALYGVYAFLTVRADFAGALDAIKELEALAAAQRDPTYMLVAYSAYGVVLLQSGDFSGTLTKLEESLAFYDPAAYATHANLEMHGPDPRTTISIWLGMALWFLGRPDESRDRMLEGLALARETRRPFTIAYALSLLAWLRAHQNDADEAERFGAEAIALCQEHGIGQWLAVATVYWGWAVAERGRPEHALAMMQPALAAYRAAGGVIILPNLMAKIAEAHIRAGQDGDALRLVTKALEIVRSSNERCWEADLHRLHGELLSKEPGRDADAEQSLQRAMAVARELGARVLELRAAASLVRFRRARGREDDGRDVLARAYNWFTQGFDTPDLRDARELLDGPSTD